MCAKQPYLGALNESYHASPSSKSLLNNTLPYRFFSLKKRFPPEKSKSISTEADFYFMWQKARHTENDQRETKQDTPSPPPPAPQKIIGVFVIGKNPHCLPQLPLFPTIHPPSPLPRILSLTPPPFFFSHNNNKPRSIRNTLRVFLRLWVWQQAGGSKLTWIKPLSILLLDWWRELVRMACPRNLNNKNPKPRYLASPVLTTLHPPPTPLSRKNFPPGADFAGNLLVFCS